MKPIRWGILGTGKIAHQFASDLSLLPDASIIAVGSRQTHTARVFAEHYNIPYPRSSYQSLVEDSEVDVIYVATPHAFHKDHIRLALLAGKPVLCEKPFTLNSKEAVEVIDLARTQGLFLMEAMWIRFLPIYQRLRDLVHTQIIGKPRMLFANLCVRHPAASQERLFTPALGGGALLDVGVYLVSLASWIFGPPKAVRSLAQMGPTGVDEENGMIFRYAEGELAVLASAIHAKLTEEVRVGGTQGQIEILHPFRQPTQLNIMREVDVTQKGNPTEPKEDQEIFEHPSGAKGLHYQAAEVMACLRQGQLESAVMPLDDTLEVMGILDSIRDQWGLCYPSE